VFSAGNDSASLVAKTPLALVSGAVAVGEVIEGLLLCLLRYAVDERERGRFGLIGPCDLLGDSWLHDGFRLSVGDVVRVEAGDCCEGGVYGIPTEPEEV